MPIPVGLVQDLLDLLKPRVWLFADDATIYLTVQSDADAEQLQDLYNLSDWLNQQVEGTQKCEVMNLSHQEKERKKKATNIVFVW